MGSQESYHQIIRRFFLVLISIAILFWALAFPLIRVGLTELSPENLTILRMFLACLIFLLLLVLFPQKFSTLQRKDVIPIFLLGFFGIIVYHLSLNYGEQYISASVASLIIATIPVFVVILAAFYLKERITKPMGIGICLCLIGVVIISLYGTSDQTLEIAYISGALAALLAAVMAAIYTIAAKKMLTRYSGLSLTAYAFLLGSLGVLPFLRPSFFDQVSLLSLHVWAAVVFLSVCSTVVAYVIWFVILEVKTTSELSVFVYFIPVVSTVINFLFFNEVITLLFLVGGFLVIFGLFLVNRKEKNTRIST